MSDPEAARRWRCTVCRTADGPFAPSGRCLGCEQADYPVREDRPPLLQIGAVVELVGLSLRTVRHYEDAGLVPPVARTAGGFRLYDDEAIGQLRLIMKMKPLGFTLDEMRELIEARRRLTDADLEDEHFCDLLQSLSRFTNAANDRLVELRIQLAAAEDFSATLNSDVERLRS